MGGQTKLQRSTVALIAASTTLVGVFGASAAVRAERVQNDVAVFAALDKVTARISKLEVPLNQPAEFGSLRLTPRACLTSAPTEPPKTTTFVEVDEVQLDGEEKRIFTGWMFAESPGLNAVEHPVFDVWLTGCKGGAVQPEPSADDPRAENEPPVRRRRRRVRR
ncbi:MAG: DUF2155 domain-containing protein [Pseudomonadota bacterium]